MLTLTNVLKDGTAVHQTLTASIHRVRTDATSVGAVTSCLAEAVIVSIVYRVCFAIYRKLKSSSQVKDIRVILFLSNWVIVDIFVFFVVVVVVFFAFQLTAG